ncbi:MAG: T9SS type A sorting domain-containing protein [Candidatus Neomarinimicrobiota bacterium]|nr:T9SS type A sorting domain-containing protein [Candidatus Neomarinimicrobiota bacterium]
MLKAVNRCTIVTIGVLSASVLIADDKLNDLINDEYENISSRTAVDYDTKVVQAWRDSAWVNKAKKVKTYDDNGYLSHKDSYKYRDGEWSLKGMTVFENNENGDPATTTNQSYRNDAWRNRYRINFSYNDGGLLMSKVEQKWRQDLWRNRKETALEYEGELCVNRTISKWRDSTWVDRAVQELSYNDAGDRTEKVTYKWRDSTWTPRHRVIYSYNDNAALSEKLVYNWTDSAWVDKARASVGYDDNQNPVQVLLEKKDSTDTWVNVSLRENTYSDNGLLTETVQSKWRDENWLPRRRYEYNYSTDRGVLSAGAPAALPKKIALSQAYPNPFNPATTISYRLLEANHVRVDIYDMVGNKVCTLVNQRQDAGTRSILWNAANDRGQPVAAGVYLYTVQAGGDWISKKMVLLK